MALDTSPLFAPLTVKSKTLRNRIVMAPMVVARGIVTPEAIAWYGQHAQGGVGLVIVEATNSVRFERELTAPKLKALVQAIHDGGALAAIQLFPFVIGQAVAPADLDAAKIAALLAQYRRAGALCAEAGFDGVEPHGAHGYLLNQFFSPEQNQRTDDYGGAIENRMRLALEVVGALRSVCGEQMLYLYRHTPVGKGYGIEESVALGRTLVGAGVDILDLSPSSVPNPGDRAAPFKAALGVPIITVNNLDDPERAVEVLTQGRADLVAVGRGLIADAEWPRKMREGRLDDIVTCIKCDNCFADLRAGRPVGCTQWS